MAPSGKLPKSSASNKADIDRFLKDVKSTSVAKVAADNIGRMIFAMDATMSRQPTWDAALQIQSEMFDAAFKVGQLEIQLAYFRGYREFDVSDWHQNSAELGRDMTRVQCRGGHTQIERVLRHGLKFAKHERLKALVFVGDCVEENADDLAELAGKLGVFGLPIFIFQEGGDPSAESVFRELARLSGGAYSRFSASSADELRDLLSAVAVFVAGGQNALREHGKRRGKLVRGLLRQLEDKS